MKNAPFSSPLARRLAQQNGLSLDGLKGTGPHGRIVAVDVERALAGAHGAPKIAPALPASAPASLPPSASADSVKANYEAGSYTELALDNMRKTIAKRLVESKQTVPHFYLSIDCDMEELMKARATLNADAPKGADGQGLYKLSVNDFIIKALALALMRVPAANAVWAEDRILQFSRADVGVAVAVEGGLFTPVVRAVEGKTLSQISQEVKDLAARARVRKLKPQEYMGGTTAVSNLGMFGVREFSAVINPPHATILAVGATEARPVVRGGALAVGQQMSVTLSCDHRVVDGALGAELLAAFKNLIENPLRMLV